MHICRISRKSFPGTNRREHIRHHFRKHSGTLRGFTTYKTTALSHHDQNNVSLISQQEQGNLSTAVNPSIQLTHAVSSVTMSEDNLSYVSCDKGENKSHSMCAKQHNCWSKGRDSKLV